jgi:hypothetical protein
MYRKTLVVSLMVGVVAALSWAAPQRGHGPKAALSEEADFCGKVLAVSVKGPCQGAVLQNARVKRLGERAFLVGETVKRSDDDEFPEATFWFPVEDVQMIRAFKSVEDVKKEEAASRKGGK